MSFEAAELGRSMYLFPVIGALQGLILLFSWFVLSTLLPETVATAILILILVLPNGGFHLDGFPDTVDGLAGGKTPEQRLGLDLPSAPKLVQNVVEKNGV